MTAYLAPFLPVFFLIVLNFNTASGKSLLWNVFWFLLIIAGLFSLGLFMHGWESTRVNLPSAFRYHLSIIPFLSVLWIIYYSSEIAELIYRALDSRIKKIFFSVFFFCIFFVIAHKWFALKTDAFLVFFGHELNPSTSVMRIFMKLCLSAFPFLFIFSVMFNLKTRLHLLFGYGLVIAAFMIYACIRSYGFFYPAYVDFNLKKNLYENFFSRVNNLISESEYAAAPRSFIPIAASIVTPGRGRNDKLLPLIELPEKTGGRCFFNWRYSYSRHTSKFYSKSLKQANFVSSLRFPNFLILLFRSPEKPTPLLL
ncbi:MAG TPA: hypothetical protein VI757_00385 [Bacteroidia bacterium]|nr:hypothetical protein [Bacteroidia bacterium]